jgi:DNA-directed RNA polymerase subunit RPC12/RpoP
MLYVQINGEYKTIGDWQNAGYYSCHAVSKSGRLVNMTTMPPNRRCNFGLSCVRCSGELVAPEKSKDWNEGQIRHFWRCPTCGYRFVTVVETNLDKDIIKDDIFLSLLET